MISEQALTAWIVFFRHQSVYGAPRVFVPVGVSNALVERGWMERDEETDWEGDNATRFTDAGLAVSDLNASDYGIDPIMQESDA